jgi:hypothetical protein
MKDQTINWITQNFEEDIVASGEALFRFKLVEFVMSEKNIAYQFLVKDGSDYVVNLTYPFKKNQKGSCDCADYITNESCAHIAASLFYLQDQFADKSSLTDNILQVQGDHKRLTKINVGQILESVSHRDLIDFIRETARKDPKLSMAIKVHFARSIELADDVDKYKSILNAIIKPTTVPNAKISVAEVRSLIYVLDDFHGQMMDCLALGQYKEAFNIFVASFDKLLYTKSNSIVLVNKVNGLAKLYHESISEFLKVKLAPELRSNFVQYLLEVTTRSYYNIDHPTHNIIFQIAQFKKKQDQPLLITACAHPRSKFVQIEQEILAATLIMLLNKVDNDMLLRLENLKISYSLIADHLEVMNCSDLSLTLLKAAMKKNKRIDRDLALKLMRTLIRRQAWTDLVDHCVRCTSETLDFDYIDQVKKHISAEQYLGILHLLEDKLQSNPKAALIMMKVYQSLEDIDAVISLCKDQYADLKIIQSCEHFVYGRNLVALTEIYNLHIGHHLDAYAGDHAHEFLVELRYHFQKNKLEKLIIPVVSFLASRYSHRPKLAKAFGLLL